MNLNKSPESTIQIKVERIEKVVTQFDYRNEIGSSGNIAEGGSGESEHDGEGP